MNQVAPFRIPGKHAAIIPDVPAGTGTQYTKAIFEKSGEAATSSLFSPSRDTQQGLATDQPRSHKRTLEEHLFDVRASCKISARQLTMHFPPDWHIKFFKQLDSLLGLEDWDKNDEPVRQDSFFTLMRLLVKLRDKRRPGIGIANHGNVVAAWTAGQSDRLTIECLPRDRVRWIVTVPVDDGYDTGAGETSIDRLLHILQPYGPSRWLDDEEGAKPSR